LAIFLFGFVKAWKKSTRIEDYVKQAQLIRLFMYFMSSLVQIMHRTPCQTPNAETPFEFKEAHPTVACPIQERGNCGRGYSREPLIKIPDYC
jgi:hypothetical protein